MVKKENKYQIAQEKQREKYKKSLDSFNAYVQKNQKNHTEKDMDLLSYLRFKAPGLILDYDSLDKDFFSKDKIVAARTVYAMNDVKLNCEYQRPRDKKDSGRNYSYEYYHEHYQNAFHEKKLYNYSEEKFNELFNSFCKISLRPLYYEMKLIDQKIYDFANYIYKNFGKEKGLKMICEIESNPAEFLNNIQQSNIEINKIQEILKGTQQLFKLSDRIVSLNLLCAFYSNYGNEYLLENHFLYYEFTSLFSNVEENKFNNCAILVNPSPLFLKKWFRDEALSSLNLVCVFSDEIIKSFFEHYLDKKRIENIKVISVINLEESLLEFDDMNCKLFFFGNHFLDAGMKIVSLKKCLKIFKLNDLMYYDYDSNVENNHDLKSQIDSVNFGCAELHLFPAGLASVKDNKRTMLLFCQSSNSVNGVINVLHYTKETEGEYQSISPKKYSEQISSNDLFLSTQKVRGQFEKKFKAAYKKPNDNRNAAQKFKFSEEIYFYYTHSWDEKNKSFRVGAYAVQPKFLKDGSKDIDSKVKIVETLKRGRQSTEEEIINWLNEKYPYSVFKSKENKIDIQKELSKIYKSAYKNKPLTLKTFVYIYSEMEEKIGERQIDILKKLCSTELGFFEMDNLYSEVVNNVIQENFELRSWHAAKAILSHAIDYAIDTNHASVNQIADEVLQESGRKDRAFSQGREHLTIKFLTSKETLGIYKKITNDLSNPLNLGAYIKLLTGLESNIVCALQWEDFVALDDYNSDGKKYQLIIRRQVCNDGSDYSGFSRREMYRKIPCSSELTDALLTRKKQILRRSDSNNPSIINGLSIVEGTDELVTNRVTKCIAPRELTKYCNGLVKNYRKDYDLTTSIPDSKKGTVETDFMNYGGDIFKTNYEHYCVHKANFDKGELDYLLGRLPETPFSRNYCDYGNDASQRILQIKQDRYSQIYHKFVSVPATYIEGELEPIRFMSKAYEDLMSEVNIKITVDEKTALHIENEYGFDMTVDKLVKGGKK